MYVACVSLRSVVVINCLQRRTLYIYATVVRKSTGLDHVIAQKLVLAWAERVVSALYTVGHSRAERVYLPPFDI